MALSGTITKTISGSLTYEIRWSATQSTSANTSTVTCKHYLTGTGYSLSISSRTVTCTVGSVEKSFTAAAISGAVTEKLLGTTTHTVTHNADGTKSVSIKGVFPIAATLSGTYISSVTASATVTLNTIPRASSVSCGTVYIGGTTSISINRASTSFKHTLTYSFGSLSGTIVSNYNSTTYLWTIPDSFASEMGSSTSKTGTITCTTYSGSTVVGTSTCTMYVRTTASTSAPTLDPYVYDSNSATTALTGSSSRFVRYFSNATFSIGAEAQSGATIESQSVTCGALSSSASTGTFSNVEDATFVFSATDSRGYTTTETVYGTLIEYVKLTCNLNSGNPTASGQLALEVSGNYFNGSFGSTSNTLTVQYRYKVGSGSYGSWTAMSATASGNTYTASATLTGLDYESNYTFEARAIDKLMTVSSSDKPISSVPLFSWCNNAFVHNTNLYFGRYGGGDGIIYGSYGGSYIGNVQPVDSSGNCIIGLGNYNRGAGDTIIYSGDEVKLICDGNASSVLTADYSGVDMPSGASIDGATITSGASISGGATVTGGATVSGGMTVSGSLNANSVINAYSGISVDGTVWVDGGVRTSNGYTINGYELPYVQSGTVYITPSANSTKTATISFSPSFKSAPKIALSVCSGSPQVCDIGWSSITASNFTIVLYRTTSVQTRIDWVAVGEIN